MTPSRLDSPLDRPLDVLAAALPAGFTARPAILGDVTAITTVIAAHELDVDGVVEIEEGDIAADMSVPSLDLATDTVIVHDRDGSAVAVGEVSRKHGEVYVHPAHRGRGLGTALAAWTWDVSRARGADRVGQTVSDAAADAIALFARLGYVRLWTSWILARDLDADRDHGPGDRQGPELPAGYTLRPFAPGADDRAVYEVIETAFAEWPDREPTSFGDWETWVMGRAGFQPWKILVLACGEEVVGAANLQVYDDTGWVQQIAVARPHRGRRLGRALLQEAFRVFAERGLRAVELSTDSRTGALGLYEHVGMRVRRSYRHWARVLDTGGEVSSR